MVLKRTMSLKIGVIGPTNLEKLSEITRKPTDFYLERAKAMGKILAETDCELWVNSDKGMIFNTGKSYKENNGKKLVVVYPHKPEPWPQEHTIPYKENADVVKKMSNWFLANYSVVTDPEVCICAGLSAGTLSELAYIKWNCQFKQGNLKKLIAVRELLRDRKLPPEIELDVKDVLIYIEKIEDLKEILSRVKNEQN